MAKLTLADLANLQNETSAVATMNSNWALIETAVENTLSRDGLSPNQMESPLDMNSFSIYNLPEATSDTEPVRKAEFDEIITSILNDTVPADVILDLVQDAINSGTFAGPLYIGGTSVDRSGDSLIIASRTKTATANVHGFSDSQTITMNVNGLGYNSYDSQAILQGTGTINHYAAYQNFAKYAGSGAGSLGTMWTFNSHPEVAATGAAAPDVTQLVHYFAADFTKTSGTVGTQYGFFADPLVNGDANWAYYSNGATPSRFNGVVKAKHVVTDGQHWYHGGVSSDGTDAAVAHTAAHLMSGIMIRSGLTAPRTDTLPTSEALCAAYITAVNGEFFNIATFHYRITNRSAQVITMGTGGDASITTSGTMTIAGNTSALFAVTVSDLDTGTCNYTFTRIDL